MACATLKRSYDFDPLVSPSQHQRSPKRRRCGPTIVTSPVQTTNQAKPSLFVEKTPKFSSGISLYWFVHNGKNFSILARGYDWKYLEGTGSKPRALFCYAVRNVGLGLVFAEYCFR